MTDSRRPALDSLRKLQKQMTALESMPAVERAKTARQLTHSVRSMLSQVGNEAIWEATEAPSRFDHTRRRGVAAVAQELGVSTPAVDQSIYLYRKWLKANQDKTELVLSDD